MAERVHPEPIPPPPPRPVNPVIPPADTTLKSFVIQLPKDQIYRVPPPENEYRINFYARRAAKRRSGFCRRCLFFSLILLFILFISIASVIAILYLIFLPQLPFFSIKSVSIKNFNLSPEISLAIRSENANRKGEIYYRGGGSVAVDFSGEVFCRGTWPSFHQGKRNVTVVEAALKGYGIRLSDNVRARLTAAVNRREVPLGINAKMPMRMRFGAIEIWTVTVKLRCDVTVDKLTANARIWNKSCKAEVDVF